MRQNSWLNFYYVILFGAIMAGWVVGCSSQVVATPVSQATEVAQTATTELMPKGDDAPFLSQAKVAVEAATRPSAEWHGPITGPSAQPNKLIVYVSSDQRNGGVAGVSRGVEEAAKVMGWKFQLLDAKGSEHGEVFSQALALKPDGIIIGGIDAFELLVEIETAHEQGVAVVGWHVAPDPGPIEGLSLFTNITTPSKDVAEIAAYYAVAQSNGRAGVVIFTDSRFQIAIAKSNAMANVIRQCKSCGLLSVEDVPLNNTAELMPQVTKALLQRFDEKWTYALGINDLYFDDATVTLKEVGIPPRGRLDSLSAGDGSELAYQRIRQGEYQVGTVPEPLLFHGWQLVDELNRAFAGKAPSGYVAPVHLVTPDNIHFDGGDNNSYDPDNGYRNEYRAIWGK